MALNCSVAPVATLAAAGEIEIAVTVFGVTLSAAVPLMPPTAAVTVVAPALTPMATPLEETVAAAAFELLQFAVEVTTAVEPSL
jgi:hypothetical protein